MSKEADKTIQRVESGMVYRSFDIDRAEMDADKRTIRLSFSSEQPVTRHGWEGKYHEVLDHSPESVDLSRLKSAAPLLIEHERSDQVGVIEDAWIGDDRRGHARVRFGKSARAEEIFQDVNDGIRRLVSVGYRVYKLVTEKIEDEVETLRATAWTPMEVSIVSVPADTSVGIGRGDKTDHNSVTIERKEMKVLLDPNASGGGSPAPSPTPPTPTAPPAAPNPPATPSRIEVVENFNHKERYAAAKLIGRMDIYEQAVNEGWNDERFHKEFVKRVASPVIPSSGTDPNPPSIRTRDGQSFRSLGDAIVGSDGYKSYKRGDRISSAVDLPMMGVRATLLTSTGLTGYERPPGIALLEQQPLTVGQLFAQGSTTQPVVRIVQEQSYVQAATAVAEEGQKPEATFDLQETDFAVRKIAVLGRVSDEMFADFPQVRDYVNNRLTFMVQSLEDNHLLNGTGASNQITGVLSTSGIQTEAAASSPTVADAIHKGLTKVRSTGFFEPDAIIMHPNDYQDLRLAKDSNGQYYAGGPFGGAYGVGGFTAMGPLWGKPVVVTTAISEGTALVGAFRIGGQIFRREGVRVESTNSDASDFAYNRICIRVEERLTLVVYRPLAFCSVTGIA